MYDFFFFKFLLSADRNYEINVFPSNKDWNKWLNHHEKEQFDKKKKEISMFFQADWNKWLNHHEKEQFDKKKRDERDDYNYKIFHNYELN